MMIFRKYLKHQHELWEVSDGEPVNAAVTNSRFVSRTATQTSTASKVDLTNADAASGTSIVNVQREHNSIGSFVGKAVNLAKDFLPTWASDLIGTPNQAVKDRVDSVQGQVETNTTGISGNASDIADIRTTTGTADGDTDMGTYTGSTITDNVDQATVNQELETEVELKINLTEKGAANGVAELDGTGRVPTSQLTLDAMEFKGAFDASGGGAGSPALTDGVGNTGDVYNVSVAGTVDHGAGAVTYALADQVIYSGTVWQKYRTSEISTGANKTLSNLDAPTAINQDLTLNAGLFLEAADSSGLNAAGNSLLTKSGQSTGNANGGSFIFQASSPPAFDASDSIPNPVATLFEVRPLAHLLGSETGGSINIFGAIGAADKRLNITTGAYPINDIIVEAENGDMLLSTKNSTATDDVKIVSGDASAGISGDVLLETGTATGTRGKIRKQDGTEGTVGHVWTSTDTTGGGEWAVTGAGSGSGRVNFLDTEEAGFETGIGVWTAYDDGGVAIVDGAGPASGTIVVTQETGSPLVGTGSLKIAKSAVLASGEGVSVASLTIDPQYRGRTIICEFEQDFTDASYPSENMSIKAIDMSLTGELAVIGDATIKNLKGKVQVQILTTTSTAQVRLALHIDTDAVPGATWNGYLDQVLLTIDQTAPASIITDWEDVIVDGTWTTNTTYTAQRRRIGDSEEYEVNIDLSGAPNAATLDVNMPSDRVINAAKIKGTGDSSNVGVTTGFDSGAGELNGMVKYIDTTTVRPKVMRELSADNNYMFELTDVAPVPWGSGNTIKLRFTVPIEGWSAGALLSTTESLLQNAKLKVINSAAQSFTGGVSNDLEYDSVEEDTLNGFNLSTNDYTIPRDGFYLCFVNFGMSADADWNGTTEQVQVSMEVNGSIPSGGRMPWRVVPTNLTQVVGGSCGLTLKKGDTIHPTMFNGSGGTVLGVASGAYNHFEVVEIPDFSTFSVFGESEYLSAEASVRTTTTLANTWIDVTGLSLPLTTGKWEIGYNCSTNNLELSGASNTVASNLMITDSSNSAVPETLSLFGMTGPANFQFYHQVSNSTEVIITSNTTYKVRVRCLKATASGEARVYEPDFSGSLTGDDASSKIWARRIS